MLKSDKGIQALLVCACVANVAVATLDSKELQFWYAMYFILFASGAYYVLASGGRSILESQTSTFEAAMVWLFAWVLIPIDITVWLFLAPGRFRHWVRETREDIAHTLGL